MKIVAHENIHFYNTWTLSNWMCSMTFELKIKVTVTINRNDCYGLDSYTDVKNYWRYVRQAKVVVTQRADDVIPLVSYKTILCFIVKKLL